MAEFGRSPQQDAVGQVRELVRRVAVEVFGARVIETPIPGFQVITDRQLDDPLTGVRAAQLLRTVAEAQMGEYARAARAGGRSWDEIGEALGLPAYEFRSRAEEAFAWLVEGREPDPEPNALPSFRTPTTWWRCGACDQQVTDHGPYGGSHPDDNETGHAPDCARRRAAIAAWKAHTGWDGENHDEDADQSGADDGGDAGRNAKRDEPEGER